jgi:hypothetical protein
MAVTFPFTKTLLFQKGSFLRHKGDTSRWVAASITNVEAAKFFESLAALEFHKFSPKAFLGGSNHETDWKTH